VGHGHTHPGPKATAAGSSRSARPASTK
jgi:hypothetical protein